jgi:hypothetical protein
LNTTQSTNTQYAYKNITLSQNISLSDIKNYQLIYLNTGTTLTLPTAPISGVLTLNFYMIRIYNASANAWTITDGGLFSYILNINSYSEIAYLGNSINSWVRFI